MCLSAITVCPLPLAVLFHGTHHHLSYIFIDCVVPQLSQDAGLLCTVCHCILCPAWHIEDAWKTFTK